MVSLNPRMIFLLIFVAAVTAFLYWDRKKISRHYILFYRRTKRGIVMIDRIASRAPNFWNYYGWTGVVTGFISIFASIALVGYTFFQIFFSSPSVSQGVKESGFSFIAPGVVSQPDFQAGISFIPVEYWVAGIGIIMLVHELSHGIVARTENFEINSVGWIILGFIPGAFVEPKGENMLPGDEENQDPSSGMWEQGSWKSRLKVLGAGSFANYITAGIFLLIAVGVTAGAMETADTGYVGIMVGQNQSTGELVYRAQEGQPAYRSGMRNGTLFSIDGEKIDSPDDIRRFSESLEVNETVDINTSEGSFSVTADKNRVERIRESLTGFRSGLQWFLSGIWTIAFLNLMIGLFNMLPFKPLDGGLMVETVLKQLDENSVRYLDSFSLIGWSLILTTMILGLLL